MKKLLLGLALALGLATNAFAQNVNCATRPDSDDSNACASTAFVKNVLSGGGFIDPSAIALPDGQVIVGDPSNVGAAVPMSGDISITDTGSTNVEAIQGLAVVGGNTGTGKVVRDNSPALITPNLGTPSAVNLANGTNLPLTGIQNIASLRMLANTTGGAAAPQAVTATSWFDAAYCNTVGRIIVRLGGGWTCDNSLPLPITWLGAVGDNATDNCTPITNALASGAKSIYVPGGTFRTSCALTQPAGTTVWGANDSGSVISYNFGTGDGWTLTTDSIVRQLRITANVTRTADYMIRLTSNGAKLADVQISNAFKAIGIIGTSIGSPIVQPVLSHVKVFSPGTGAGSLCLYIQNYSSPLIDDMTCSGNTVVGTQPEKCLVIADGDTVLISNFHCVAYGLSEIVPTAGNFSGAVQMVNFLFDSPNAASAPTFRIQPPATSNVINCRFTNGSFSNALGATAPGLLVDGNNGEVSDCSFVNVQAAHNTDVGFRIQGANAKSITIMGGAAPGNVQGIFLQNQASAIIQGVNFRASGGYAANSNCDVGFAGASTGGNTLIAGNLMTAGLPCGTIFNGSTAITNVIRDNLGYNPVGGAAITVGASPYTYRASSSPETVYIRGGTVSSIVVGGRTIATAVISANSPITVDLGPNETVIVTYTVLPTMDKYIH